LEPKVASFTLKVAKFALKVRRFALKDRTFGPGIRHSRLTLEDFTRKLDG